VEQDMFLKKIFDKQRTLAFRLTLWYTAIFTISSLGAFSLFYFTVSSVIQKDLDADLLGEVEEFSSLLAMRGFEEAEAGILAETQSEGIHKVFFRVVDLKGEPIFSSDMSFWKDVGIAGHALKQLANGTNHAFETLSIPGRKHETRIVYGHFGSDTILQIGKSLEEDVRFMGLLRHIFSLVMGPLIIFSGFIGWFMARRALSGVEEVTQTAHNISKGAFERRVQLKTGGKEIERLATVFNKMLDHINTLINGMREVSDNIAHDLKTPITRIHGMAEMHLDSGESNEEMLNFAADIMGECENLLQMINTMLDISETEAGTIKLEIMVIHISKMTQKIIELFQPLAEEKGICILSEVPDNATIRGDFQSIQRVLLNLLENAVKYTPSEGKVVISFENDDEKGLSILSINDTGIGISDDDLPHIFKRLYRCDTSRSQPGFGLGLSLALAIARAHGGDIVASSQLGKGSQFTVTLPQ
jgi:signal transduction histidine kinase